MDSDELEKSQSDEYVKALLGTLKPLKINPTSDIYSATNEVKVEYEENLERKEKEQQLGHRDQLMNVISFLAIGSFLFLALIILIQMSLRYHNPTYTGVSDDVIKVMAVSVFGQVIAVVGTLSYHIFSKHK